MKYLICNLKAHKTFEEMLEYREEITSLKSNTELILAPSNIYLSLFKGKNVSLCTQNLNLNEELELTGDTSIKQLESLGVKYALIGHYERKKYYNETEREIISKLQDALKHKMKVIYCIGETKEERARKVEYQVLERMLAKVLNNIPREEFKNIIIAYEPTYLIGNNEKYNVKEISNAINFIKVLIKDYYDTNIDVVFGGNINLENVNELIPINNLDGFIIGNSSLNCSIISEILHKIDVK